MFKIKILTVGKCKEPWLQEALAEFTQRLQGRLSIEWILAKSDTELKHFVEKEKEFFFLSPEGTELTSEQFSTFFCQALQEGNSRVTFVIGGAEGLDPSLKKKAKKILSLSRLTFTHQMTRLILLEQLYRALEIERGSPYHK